MISAFIVEKLTIVLSTYNMFDYFMFEIILGYVIIESFYRSNE